MHRSHLLRRLRPLAATIFPLLLCGCVALDIPSQRYHDPEDSGGLFGPWVPPADTQQVLSESTPVAKRPLGPIVHPTAPDSAYCPSCGDSPEPESGAGLFAEPQPVEPVPWPRFHPLPTRPVFGGPPH